MPKIDTSVIDGFDAMNPEEKLEAILGLEIPEKVDLSGYIAKAQFDKAASELAETKRKLRDRMTDDEAAKAEIERARNELQEKYDALLKDNTISRYKAQYMSQGYDEKLASETANALYSGEMDKVFANGEKFRSVIEQKVKSEVLKNTPKPDGAGAHNDDEKTLAVQLAEKIGKANAEAAANANKIMDSYEGGK